MRISAVLACHNEEFFIQAWLEETVKYADEILIALHAPTDRTADIIAHFKANSPVPIHCEWFPTRTVLRFGFSVMKNEMIARASGDWVTSIDADEEIGLTGDELRELLEQADSRELDAVRLLWAEPPLPRQTNPTGTMADRRVLRESHVIYLPQQWKWKVFRNRRGIWWSGLVHEELYQGRCHVDASSLATGSMLHHYAYLIADPPVWKFPLLAYLLCRGLDHPEQRAGTNRRWFEEFYPRQEASLRAAAALLDRHLDDWFPEVAARSL